jgi:hypothetical protein
MLGISMHHSEQGGCKPAAWPTAMAALQTQAQGNQAGLVKAKKGGTAK